MDDDVMKDYELGLVIDINRACSVKDQYQGLDHERHASSHARLLRKQLPY